MKKFCAGICRTVWLTDDAATTLAEAESLVPPNKAACKAQLRRVLERLANHHQVRNDDLFCFEEDGIFAVKARCGLRGYGWFQEYDGESAFIVAKFIMKKKQKADPQDLESAKRSRSLLAQGVEQ